MFDYIKRVNPGSTLVGFLMGPHGVYTGAYTIIDDALMAKYRNMGVRAGLHVPRSQAPGAVVRRAVVADVLPAVERRGAAVM